MMTKLIWFQNFDKKSGKMSSRFDLEFDNPAMRIRYFTILNSIQFS